MCGRSTQSASPYGIRMRCVPMSHVVCGESEVHIVPVGHIGMVIMIGVAQLRLIHVRNVLVLDVAMRLV